MIKSNASEDIKPLRVLLIEDSEDDAFLVIRQLKKGGYDVIHERVDTAAALRESLQEKQWDIILCDYKMPHFSAPAAISLLKETQTFIPILIVSGNIGEETAIECMHLGAQDYIMKSNLSRLCPAISRELDDAKIRTSQKLAETQRENALDVLRQSEERYRTILENMQEGFFEVDRAGNFTFVNDALCFHIGYAKDEIIGVNYKRYTGEEEAQRVFQAFNMVYRTGKTLREFRWQVTRKDGDRRYIAGSISPKKDASGNIIGFTGIARDITETMRAEDELKKSEKFFKEITENASDIIVITDETGMIKYCSPSIERFAGYKSEEVIGKDARVFIHPDEVQRASDEFDKALVEGRQSPLPPKTFRIMHKDGSERYFYGTGKVLLDHPDIAGVVINISDITEQKKIEEKLHLEEQMFRCVTEQSSDIIIIINQKGMVSYENPAIENILGYKTDERIGRSAFELIHPDDAQAIMQESKALLKSTGSSPGKKEMRFRHKDGHWRTFEATASNLVIDHVVQYLVVNMHDITERKKAENALKESELKYRNIFEYAVEGIYQVTLDGRFITANNAFVRMAGYDSPEDLIESIKDIKHDLYVHASDRDIFLKIMETKGYIEGFETQFFRKDRSVFWVALNARAVKDEQGKMLYNEGFVEDITLRKQAEENLKQSLERLKKAVSTTIQILVSALEVRDPYTAGHQSRSADLACAIAAEMGLSQDQINGIRMAGIIHDIGKISVPVEILSKPSRLTNLEFSLIKEHAQNGFEMLKDIESPWPLAQIVQQHHERMNGTGYPKNLKGDDILIEARILTVADVVEAMASHRPYRPSLGIEMALEEIEKNKGVLYDENAVNACIRLFRERGYSLQ